LDDKMVCVTMFEALKVKESVACCLLTVSSFSR